MVLKYKITALDEVDEALRALYRRDGDAYLLDVDENPAKNALEKVRTEKSDAEKRLKDLEDRLASEEKAKERAALEKAQDYEKLRASFEAEKAGLKQQLEAASTKLRNGLLERAALDALTQAGAIPKALLPHVVPALDVVEDRVIVRENPAQSVGDFVTSLKQEMPWGFIAQGPSGTGTKQTSNQTSTKTMSRAAFDALDPAAKMAAVKDGTKITE